MNSASPRSTLLLVVGVSHFQFAVSGIFRGLSLRIGWLTTIRNWNFLKDTPDLLFDIAHKRSATLRETFRRLGTDRHGPLFPTLWLSGDFFYFATNAQDNRTMNNYIPQR